MSVVDVAFSSAQQGCLPKRGIDVASLATTLMIQMNRCIKGASFLFCFLDIEGVFYTVLRELLMPMKSSGVELEELVDQLGVPLAFQGALEQLLAQPSLLQQLLLDKHLISSITEAFSGTWYTMKHSNSAVQTKLGVAPGDQLADVMYNL
jgi:hypothetical protein